MSAHVYFLLGQTKGERKVVFWSAQGRVQDDIVPQVHLIVVKD